ncbi:hypothetical protein G7Z17_g13074 [Cylindrodendrum hubeiense]|uniref:Xylanolytic transcriptional activator regulatory domain-containing protein n=1 Tax=Cylindrodendrum hubeiense TaxID=595255 RepID=A0A9P5L2J9_9HYPO|nr:hypothetical protein G7Z17_g13074 [Cylindrodendrum hubeiense]
MGLLIKVSLCPRLRCDTASWAAILIVVGLGLQSPIPGHESQFGPMERKDWNNYCMGHAQSAVSELATRDEDLLGIQVLVALAMLFQNTFDFRPSQYFTADEALDRSNVLWVTYIVDKDMGFKAKVPSMLSDADINIPMDPCISNKTGIIFTEDGDSQLNIFRQRIELAQIEGKVYDLLYSSRSIKLETSERKKRVESLQKMLDDWQTTCAHFSSLIILLANILIRSAEGSELQDLQLVAASMEFYDRQLEGVHSMVYDSIKLVIEDLRSNAVKMVGEIHFGHPDETVMVTTTAAGRDPNVFSDNVLLDFEYHEEQLSSLGFDDLLTPYFGEDEVIPLLDT